MDMISTIPLALAALAATVGAIYLLAAVARRSGLAATARPGRRLSVVETVALDPRRRLVLARCDGGEALLLVGGESDQVVGWVTPPGSPVVQPEGGR
ncbi:flagellar biosynthetic protein FliO [Elioraea rosea]|uniref:flagellar biosynthetic protein FliO n=1 Tax=Elioraea rosea TaxID=2492390 RepID=UPI0011833F12|nr:flagellar biosynthetic protein FliO [Elioraea rosea]